jgi:hypothetical protein
VPRDDNGAFDAVVVGAFNGFDTRETKLVVADDRAIALPERDVALELKRLHRSYGKYEHSESQVSDGHPDYTARQGQLPAYPIDRIDQ